MSGSVIFFLLDVDAQWLPDFSRTIIEQIVFDLKGNTNFFAKCTRLFDHFLPNVN